MVVALGPGRFYGSALPRPRYQPNGDIFDEGWRAYPPPPVNEALIQWAEEAHWRRGGWRCKPLSQVRRKSGRIDGSINRLRKQLDDDGGSEEVEVKRGSTRGSRDPAANITHTSRESSPESDEDEELTKKPVRITRASGNSAVNIARKLCESSPESAEGDVVLTKKKNKPARATHDRESLVKEEPDGKWEKKRAGITRSREEESAVLGENKRRRVRKLVDDFDRIASVGGSVTANEDVVAESPLKAVAETPSRRTSPRKKTNDEVLSRSPNKVAAAGPTRRTSPRTKNNGASV